ncbi:carboxymethylenebutenolidase [Sporothrix schenckii 1099-18]|uniref:Dienelactone hydrolase domain-containing protein n=2 Tax=Sporothrix schenckii TaxID=29908 RepID=U7PUM9_SPOS1|nr:carboxymethylenebutenolidase [Sporothrix schenckii 1099-18]ERS98185.1 hypothetical protein HMPREF1624_04966 [Sporothrix schenckii ATCC 58251]KJR89716.1 carboxymethylenebutenolidase [Sporothrix schenckii 1099-18]
MSTPAELGHSDACCNVPPIVASGYEIKGEYKTVGDLKTYATGPDDATKGIIYVFDIFGYKDQTLQGADILSVTDKHQPYKVLIPDWFGDEPAPLGIFPPDTEDKKVRLMGFLGKHPPPVTASKLPAYVKAASEAYPTIKSWGVIGFCWGGKVVSLVTSGAENPFAAGAEAHPAMVDAKDAVGIKVPLVMLASKDEPPADVDAFEKALTVPHHVETFADQVHGWMAARADLADEHIKSEYVRGYKTVVEFFSKHV